jgi:hypothetical protein
MKQVVVNIPDNKYTFFIELVKNLGFTPEIKSEDKQLTYKQQQFVDELKESLNQVEQHMQGKIKLKTADELLNEL